MKTSTLLIGFAAIFATACATSQTGPVADNDIGLSKTSVFDDPTPETFEYGGKGPGSNILIPQAYEGAPPQIPHKIDAFMPIKTEKNLCVNCHDKPSMVGKPKVKGVATTMPESHYNSIDGKFVRNNGRHFCTQCHVPQATVGELVGNTFKTDQ
jgi:cytochrome c-type protein NapB